MSDTAESARVTQVIEVEQQVLGECLLDADRMDACAKLQPHHFLEPVHQRLWAAMQARRLSGEGVSVSMMAPLFRTDPGIAELGGVGYLARLAGCAISPQNLKHYVPVLIESFEREELRRVATAAADAAIDMARKPREAIEALQGELLAIEAEDERQDRSIYAVANEWLNPLLEARHRGESLMGVCSGLRPLDEITGGLYPGDLTVLAGRPGMGKSVVGLFYAWAVARTGGAALFVSREMSEAQISARLLSLEVWAETRRWIEYRRIIRGDLDDLEARLVWEAGGRLKDIALRVTPPECASVGAIAAAARRAQRIGEQQGRPLELVVIDYLGLVKPPRERNSKVNEIGDITGAFKAMARQMGVPVLLLSQLNRGVEQRGRDDRKPVISDLRDSGDIEQDADRIMLLYRPAYYLAREEPQQAGPDWDDWRARMDAAENVIEIDVAKNRMGETGRVRLWCAVGICAMSEVNGGPPA